MDTFNSKTTSILIMCEMIYLSTCLPLDSNFNIGFNARSQNSPAAGSFFGFTIRSPTSIIRPIFKTHDTLKNVVFGNVREHSDNDYNRQNATPPNKNKINFVTDTQSNYEKDISIMKVAKINDLSNTYNSNKNSINSTIEKTDHNSYEKEINKDVLNSIFNEPTENYDQYTHTMEDATVYTTMETGFYQTTQDSLDRIAPAPIVATLLG